MSMLNNYDQVSRWMDNADVLYSMEKQVLLKIISLTLIEDNERIMYGYLACERTLTAYH